MCISGWKRQGKTTLSRLNNDDWIAGSVDDFVQELKAEYAPQAPKETILRLTNLFGNTSSLPIRYLSILATIKSHTDPADVIYLERFCGQIWGFEREVRREWLTVRHSPRT